MFPSLLIWTGIYGRTLRNDMLEFYLARTKKRFSFIKSIKNLRFKFHLVRTELRDFVSLKTFAAKFVEPFKLRLCFRVGLIGEGLTAGSLIYLYGLHI